MFTQKMHRNELDTDVSLVGRLLAVQFPQWAGLPIERFSSSGTVNALYRLGADMVVRLPLLQQQAVGDGRAEHQWQQRLARLLPVAIPTLLATGRPGEGYPCQWTVYRWLDGDNPVPGHLDKPDALAHDLAEFIAALHRIDPAGGPPTFRAATLASKDSEVRTCIAQLSGIVDTDAVTAAWDAALRIPTWTGPPVLVHGDLLPGNVLVTAGRLSAVIDWWAGATGDPACDLMVAWNLVPASSRQIVRAGVQVDDATWERGRGWALSKGLIALPYYKDTNPVMANNARHVLGELFGEL